MTSRTREWTRLDGVDFLRALAIFYVLMNHVNMRLIFTKLHYLRNVPPPLADALVWQGQAGVQIFFAVSGFLIAATSIRRWGSLDRLNVREFYILRIARIAPLLLTLLAVLSVLHLLQVKNFVVSPEVGGLKAALVAALTLRVGLLEATRGYLPGNWDILWSLSVEELFYLGFPLICRLLRRGRWLIAVLAAFVVLGPFGRTVLSYGNETWQEYSYLGGMDAIAMGCLTALLVANVPISRRISLTLTLVGGVLLVFCVWFSPEIGRFGLEKLGLGMTLLALATCLLIAAANATAWRAPEWFQPVLGYGRRSYEVYLTHMFVVFACFDFFMAHTACALWTIPILFVVSLALSGVLGEVIGRFYSEPANRWLRRKLFGEREPVRLRRAECDIRCGGGRETMSAGVELWLVRHGETEWSLSGAHTSRTDIPLTDHGRRRAEELREFLKGMEFAKVLVSPMQRARETCEIAGFAAQAVVEPGLVEWDYGESEGKTTKEMRAKYNDPDWSVWSREIVGGEPVEQVGERADGVIARALDGVAPGGKVALFAHAHILRITAARWIGLEAKGGRLFGLGTGSVSVLGWERETRIISRWNREFE